MESRETAEDGWLDDSSIASEASDPDRAEWEVQNRAATNEYWAQIRPVQYRLHHPNHALDDGGSKVRGSSTSNLHHPFPTDNPPMRKIVQVTWVRTPPRKSRNNMPPTQSLSRGGMARTKEITKGRETAKRILPINCLPTARATTNLKTTSTKKFKGIPKRREQTL